MSVQLFERSYIMNNADYRSSPQFLSYIISNIIYDYFQVDRQTFPKSEYVVEKTIEFFGADNVHPKNIKNFIRNYFTLPNIVNDSDAASLPRTCLAAIERVRIIKVRINKHPKRDTTFDNETTFLRVLHRDGEDLNALIEESILFEYNDEGGDTDECFFRLFMSLKDGQQNLLDDINRYILNANISSDNVSVNSLSLSSPVIRLCSVLKIRKIKDFKILQGLTILGIFVLHIEELLSTFQKIKLPDNYEDDLEDILSKDFSVLDLKEKKALEKHYIDVESFAKIAEDLSVSRSTASNLLERAITKLRIATREHIGMYTSYLNALKTEKGDFDAKYQRLLSNVPLAIKLLLVFSVATKQEQQDIDYYDLVCLYYRHGIVKELQINVDYYYVKEFKENNYLISQQDFKKLDTLHQRIVIDYYSKIGDHYIAGRHSFRDLLVEVCDGYFPNGIRPSDSKDISKLRQALKVEYDLNYVSKNPNVIVSALTSRGYILCNRGTYINKSKCPILRSELINKILEYIRNINFSNISYAVIYQHFKNDYLMSGVSNEYMLKGLLDPFIQDIYETHRDYIHKDIDNPEYENPTELLASCIRSFSGEFTWQEIKDAPREYFKDHTIAAVLYEEEKYDGLLPLSNGKYIYYDDLDVSRETIKKLGHYLDNLFSTFKYNTINVSIIFSNLQIQDPSLLTELKEAGTNSFALFSFIREAYGDKYSYHRPNISIESGVDPSHYNLMYDYIKDKKSFDDNDVYTFMDYNNISREIYAKFLERDEVCKNFVRVNAHDFVSKDSFNLSDDDLDQIDVWINNYILKYEELNTANFNLYSVLPVVMHKWNKYLLSGIVRTYLGDKYSVTNTTTGYLRTDFIIRRKKNGK